MECKLITLKDFSKYVLGGGYDKLSSKVPTLKCNLHLFSIDVLGFSLDGVNVNAICLLWCILFCILLHQTFHNGCFPCPSLRFV